MLYCRNIIFAESKPQMLYLISRAAGTCWGLFLLHFQIRPIVRFLFFSVPLWVILYFFFLTHRPSAPLESPLAVYHPLTGLTLEPPLSHAAEGSLVWLLQELRLIPGETPPLLPLFRVVWLLCSLQTRTFPLSQLFIVSIYLSISSVT